MTYGAPFPLVQFQFQVGGSRFSPDSRASTWRACGTDRWRVQPFPFGDAARTAFPARAQGYSHHNSAKYATSKL